MNRLPVHKSIFHQNISKGFRISEYRDLEAPVLAYYPHKHDFYQVIYISQGYGEHIVDFHPCEVNPPCLYFLFPGQVHFWRLKELPQGCSILFTEEFLYDTIIEEPSIDYFSFFYNMEISPCLELNEKQNAEVSSIVGKLKQEYDSNYFGSYVILRSFLLILLIYAQRWINKTKKSTKGSNQSVVRQFKRYISEDCARKRSIQHYAGKLGISSGHLSNVVKHCTGESPGKIIREQVVLEAKRLLIHTEKTAAEVAYELNFKDPSYFGRFFRREVGMSPLQYRTRIKEQYQLRE